GPPGTGKSLVTRFLIGSCANHSVIVPSDMMVETLRECFRLANYLQPSILVIEDVDLLAPSRDAATQVDGLQELMNEMDGLNAQCDTTVIMSTNRPQALEPALASRPGRVSQAVAFPLPDQELREQLLRLFLGDTVTGTVLIHDWAQRTEAASPAFLEELCKRAIVIASERVELEDDHPGPPEVQFNDLEAAIHELVVMGGELTSKVLGFPS
ncbi:MAG: AAA family ATPase, partial [Pirellulales bacterium]|nr:AAA family ATPase [Pirellulales bacterium]